MEEKPGFLYWKAYRLNWGYMKGGVNTKGGRELEADST